MFGLSPFAVNEISLLLINGTKLIATTLSPKLWVTVWGTKSVLIPLLVCTTSTVVVVTISLPVLVVAVLGFPDHWSCHSFHSVPNGIDWVFVLVNPNSLAKLSNVPLRLTTRSGARSVSFHSSNGGSNSILPIQVKIKNGFKFSTFVANGCSITEVCV